jgi:hypothetical protein
MATTTNFGWTTPDDTSLVKDGAAAIRTLGQSIDTSMMDLEGGTTGQVLSKASNADMDFTWVTSDDANAIQNAIVDAKGDLIAATAADTPARLAVGTNGQVLTADSTAATGLKWGTAAAGSLVYVGGASFSASSSQSLNNVFTSTYKNYLVITNIDSSSTNLNIFFRMRASGTDSSASYYSNRLYNDLSAGGTSFGGQSISNGANWHIQDANGSNAFGFTFNLFNPQEAKHTTFQAGSSGSAYGAVYYQSFTGGVHAVATAYDGITIFPSSGNITGSIRVYGIANS